VQRSRQVVGARQLGTLQRSPKKPSTRFKGLCAKLTMVRGNDRNKTFASAVLPIGTALLSILYLAHTLLYLFGTTNADGSASPQWLAIPTGGSTILFGAMSLYARREKRNRALDSHLAGMGALIVLANVSIHFAASGEIWHGYNFVFYQIAIGALITSPRWFAALVILTPLASLAAGAVGLGYIPWNVFAALVILGSSLSIVVFVSRRHAILKLESMTRVAEKSRGEAEEALAESQKNAERLERSQRDLQGILDKSPEAILIRQDDRITYMNPAFLDCLRVEEREVVGTPMASLLVDSNDTPTMRTRALLRRSDGQVIVMQLSEPEEVQYQGQSCSLVMGHDITDQDTSLKAKLLLADRMAAVGVLASGIAHEINNPMAYVLGNLEILNAEIEQLTPGMSDDARSELRELLADCLHGSERVTSIVQELRTVARPEPSGGVADLRQAIESAIKIANNQITHKSAEVDLSIPPSLSAVCGSTSKLSQVFLNLLVNAAQSLCADDSDNAIQIQATQEPAFVRVQVRDTGAGMSPESQRRLFEPFFTTKGIGEGTGLGLYFCRNELTRIGGSIDFESELGAGTTFTVRIPVLPPAN